MQDGAKQSLLLEMSSLLVLRQREKLLSRLSHKIMDIFIFVWMKWTLENVAYFSLHLVLYILYCCAVQVEGVILTDSHYT